MNLEIVSLLLIAIIIIVWEIAVVHTLPGKIAEKRGQSQVEAIEITSYLGLRRPLSGHTWYPSN